MNIPILSTFLQVVVNSVNSAIETVYCPTTLEIDTTLWSDLEEEHGENIICCAACNEPIENISNLGLVFQTKEKSNAICKDFYCINKAYVEFLPPS